MARSGTCQRQKPRKFPYQIIFLLKLFERPDKSTDLIRCFWFILDELKGRAKSVQKENKPSDEEIPVTISDDNNADNKYNNLFCSDAQILVNAIERIKTKDNENSGINVENILTGENLKQKLKAKKIYLW